MAPRSLAMDPEAYDGIRRCARISISLKASYLTCLTLSTLIGAKSNQLLIFTHHAFDQ